MKKFIGPVPERQLASYDELMRLSTHCSFLNRTGSYIDAFDGGTAALHFQHFVGLTENIGRFARELADLQQSLVETRAALTISAAPSRFANLTF